MELLCPSCRTPLPVGGAGVQAVLTCATCAIEVDATRQPTVVGKPRFAAERSFSGARVGSYELADRLGAGGMGTVYRARRADQSEVAIKFIAPALLGDATLRARFDREIALLENLAHPAIVRILDHGEYEGVPWFAMELVNGPTLARRLADGPLRPEEVVAIFGAILSGLVFAHGRGVVHRDLKPANVLLPSEGARLVDFGAAHLDADRSLAMTVLTQSATVLGTVAYMSPEQRAGRPVDARSDLFAVGVMLYEAVTGRLPQGAFAPPSRLAAARRFSRRFDLLVNRLLQPEPADRFTRAAEVARELSAALRPASMARRLIAVPLVGAAVAGALVLMLGGGGEKAARVGKAAGKVETLVAPVPEQLLAAPEAAPQAAQQNITPPPPLEPSQKKPRSSKVSVKNALAEPAIEGLEEKALRKQALGKKKLSGKGALPPVFKTVQYQQQAK